MIRLDVDALEASGARIWRVSDLLRDLRAAVERSFPSVLVEGEVTNLTRHASGHVYFSLKDDAGQLRCVLFRLEASRLGFAPADGERLVAFGDVTVYDRKGELQLIVRRASRRGAGRAAWELEAMRRRLAAEGLFAHERKRPIPFFPLNIGIVTSRSGAALQDILSVLRRRAPCVGVFILPVRVQGDGAAAVIAEAIDAINDWFPIEVLIVGRGGGSAEDLSAFDCEDVARAVARSRAPVISAVGHEVDVTTCDLVADVRAPTPSVAAELAAPDCGALSRGLEEAVRRLVSAEARARRRRLDRLDGFLDRWGLRAVRGRVRSGAQTLDELSDRLARGASRRADLARAALREHAARLEALSPLATLSRGYAIVERLPERALVRAAEQVGPGDDLRLRFARGEATARVTAVAVPLPADGAVRR
ncbi:MAG TPA: exodeoxyribonuclease VII large subunit [Gemmatimonadota bacterium]